MVLKVIYIAMRTVLCPINILAYLFLLLTPPSTVFADTKVSSGSWFGYTAKFKFKDSLRAFFDIQPRFLIDSPRPRADGDLNTLNLRGAFGYQLDDNFSSYLGYAVVPTYEPKRVEHRAFQDLFSVHIDHDIKFSNRLRFEQRFLEGIDDVSLRGRYQSSIQKSLSWIPNLSLLIYDEAFFNFNDIETSAPKGFEQNRAFWGFNYQISSDFSVDMGYLNQYQERRGSSSDVLTNVLFLGFTSSIDLS